MHARLSGFLLGLGLALLSEIGAHAAEEHAIRSGPGQPTVYVVAEDEVHNLTRDRSEPVAAGGAPRLRAQAAGDADTRDLVLYPKGAARTEWNRRVLTREVLVRLAPGVDDKALARSVGAVSAGEVAYAPRHFLFKVMQPGAALQVAAQLAGRPGVEHVEPVLARKLAKRLVPNDPLFPQQWTIRNTGQNGATAGADINVTGVWDTYRGAGIIVGVIDDGLLYTHPDLAANANTAIHYDYRDGDADPKPEGTAGVNGQGSPNADSHGTATAGVIAARGNNGIGSAGVAYEATLVGLRLIGGTAGDAQEGASLAHSNQVIHIYNNSWGPNDDGFVKGGAGTLAQAALRNGVTTGRGGRGNIYVWAAGNGGVVLDNAGYDSYNGSIYTISVGALNDLGQRADYSERGACLIVAAPSGAEQNGRPQGTTTTDLLGDFGYNRSNLPVSMHADDTLYLDGVSFGTASSINLSAKTLQLRNVNFPNGSTVILRSQTGILAQTPNTGLPSVPGHVNMLLNVEYGGNPAQVFVGNQISITTPASFDSGELANRDYTQNYNGTSSAAPVVSGVVALMLQANPNLGWRDVQEILVRTATQTDASNAEWRTNKAGIKFNPNFGAGRVNAGAAVAMALNWSNLATLVTTASEQTGLNVAVPDNDATGITRSFDLGTSNLRVEQAVVTVDITHANRGDLVINLISPSGTVSPLAELHGDTNANYAAMSFRSTFNWGEDSKGVWQVQISDRRANNAGTLTSAKLEVFGTTPAAPTLLAKALGNGQFTLGVAGTPALGYTLQVNTNATVANWTTLFSTNAPASSFDLVDTGAGGARRFYRIVR